MADVTVEQVTQRYRVLGNQTLKTGRITVSGISLGGERIEFEHTVGGSGRASRQDVEGLERAIRATLSQSEVQSHARQIGRSVDETYRLLAEDAARDPDDGSGSGQELDELGRLAASRRMSRAEFREHLARGDAGGRA